MLLNTLFREAGTASTLYLTVCIAKSMSSLLLVSLTQAFICDHVHSSVLTIQGRNISENE